MRTPAEAAGCCGASCKEECVRPPCPCNMDAWSIWEKDELEARKTAPDAQPSSPGPTHTEQESE